MMTTNEVFAFGLHVGCAFRDAYMAGDDDRYGRLCLELPPLVREFRATGDPEPTRARLREIMGADWEPVVP